MHLLATITILLALAATSAQAAKCKDDKGKLTRCPAVAAAPAEPVRCKDPQGKFIKCDAKAADAMTDAKSDAAADTRADGMPSVSKAPVCKTGKPCGKACIAKDRICHKS
jgi:hypothetical protein